ncbi:major facilitator superfamily protein [Actinidia rufa]|uniref:Major facilitator superfamily protein n=1 Tax=Actinidia rufa TaxID=165716 RepID=A0A7J0F774_9ERIC|nr:major facilitator superfamily protein [Actinidia rufa]
MEKLGSLSHLFATVFLSNFAAMVVMPGITDVTMSALCPGQDQCSLAIYLTGLQQAITGVGTVLMVPLIGKLSDVYGRKALLTLPLTISIIPHVILAYSRTTNFFYAYYVSKILTAMISEGSLLCLALAYVADNVSEGRRASAFGIVLGVTSAAYVCGTLAARLLSTAQTFQALSLSLQYVISAASIVSIIAVTYMRIFLEDTKRNNDPLKQPILITAEETAQSDEEPSKKVEVFKKIPSLKDLVCLLKTRETILQAAVVAFFYSLGEGGLQASTLLVFMPVLAPIIGEEKLLSIALFVGFVSMLVDSVAWSIWVPYFVAAFCTITLFASPCLRSIVSKQVGPNEQGTAQGCISGITSFANIISPLIFSPLTDLFLSKRAPFYFPGFSILCAGLLSVIALIPSLMIKAATPRTSNNKEGCDGTSHPFLGTCKANRDKEGLHHHHCQYPLNIRKLRSSLPPETNKHLADIPFRGTDYGLPSDSENTNTMSFIEVIRLFSALEKLESPFKHLIMEITERDGYAPVCIISGMFLGWTVKVARELGIFQSPAKIQQALVPCDLKYEDGADIFFQFRLCQFTFCLCSDSILLNTMEGLGQKGVKYFSRKTGGKPVWTIGPISNAEHKERLKLGEKLSEWLDLHPPASVLYVSFGSQIRISLPLMKELAMGLEASGKAFIWVARPPQSSLQQGTLELNEAIKVVMEETEKGEEMRREVCEVRKKMEFANKDGACFKGSSVKAMYQFIGTVISATNSFVPTI